MPRPRVSIRLFLADGSPEGLWLVEKGNWNGLGLVIPRARYAEGRARTELMRPGVYVLVGPSETVPDRERVYVGEADVLRNRLDQQQAAKDSGSKAVVFTSQGQTLNRAHVKYLEAQLIRRAREVGRVEVDNGNAPALPSLSEADRAEMDGFLDELLTLYSLLDVRAFESVAVTSDAVELRASGPSASGRGIRTSDGFLVLAGSVARASAVPTIPPSVQNLRASLLAEGVLVQEGLETLRFTRDYLFNSPSTAAAVVLARSANGRVEWEVTAIAEIPQSRSWEFLSW